MVRRIKQGEEDILSPIAPHEGTCPLGDDPLNPAHGRDIALGNPQHGRDRSEKVGSGQEFRERRGDPGGQP